MTNPEYILSIQVRQYMRWKHPNVVFRFDMAGLNLSEAQAGKNKAIQFGRGWPDLFIAHPVKPFPGLFLELKADGFKLKKKNGDWLNTHIAEQAEMIRLLRFAGFCCDFSIGYDETIGLIEEYLKG